jgi:membrane protease YdiL (CAAX protease family)
VVARAFKSLFICTDGRLRHAWRAALYFLVGNFVVLPLAYRAIRPFAGNELSARNILLGELALFSGALACTFLFARYEGRRVDSYGLPIGQALGARTFEGALAGILMAGAVAGGMYALGGMQVHGFATTGASLWISALAWLAANVCIGVAEEFWYRSYLLQSLWRAFGFWPGALLIALVFTADHYFFKTGENVWDVVTLMSLSLLMCYSVLRTGTLWFAVGFHVAFDYMQLFVIGTPNGSQLPIGRLLDVSFSGPAWLTGGVLGTEASFLMYPMIALLWLYVWLRFPAPPPTTH